MVKLLLKKSYLHKNLKEVSFRDLWDSHGIFTTMRVIGKSPKIFLYKEHINNLIKSLKIYKLYQSNIRQNINYLVKNSLKKKIKYDHLLRVACDKNFISISLRRRLKPHKNFYLRLLKHKRVDPQLKNLKYGKILKELGKYDTTKNDLVLCYKNQILETGTSNLFLIKKNEIFSPYKNFYKGVTYKYFNKSIKIKNKNIFINKMDEYSEILLIGSGKGVTSVSEIPSINWKRKNKKMYVKLNKIYKRALRKLN